MLAFVDGSKAGESRLFPQEGDKGEIVAAVPFPLSGSVPGSRTQVTRTFCKSEQESDEETINSKPHILEEEGTKVQIVKEICVVTQLASVSE